MTTYVKTVAAAFEDAMDAPVDHGRQLNAIDAIGAYRLLLGRNPQPNELESCLGSQLTLREFLSHVTESAEFDGAGGVFPPNRTLMAEVHGFRFWFNTSDREMGVQMALGRYEPRSAALLKRIVRPGMRCLDVGAQTGFFTALMATLTGPQGAVDAFEPMPGSYELLQRNIAENGWKTVRGHNVAASDAAAEIEMSRVNHMYVAGRVEGADIVRVPTVRLDEVVTGPVDLIKLDIEGHEPAALAGMIRIIGRSRPIIISECNEYWLRLCSAMTSADYCRMLEEFGYVLFNARDLRSPIDARHVRLDVLETMDVVAVPHGTSLEARQE
jgi:FkbM family methyltransferase